MRNLFLSMAAVAMLASCSSEEVLDKAQEQKTPISFKTPFVDNMTRNVVTSKASKVWGWEITSENETNFFSGINVSESGDYNETAYWIDGASYEFVAVAPQTLPSGSTVINAKKNTGGKPLVSILTYTNDGKSDLMFANASASTASDKGNDVALNFQHMLSKIKFTFVKKVHGGILTVSNVKVKASDSGKFEAKYVTNGYEYTWEPGEESTEYTVNGIEDPVPAILASGTETNELLMIPSKTSDADAVTTLVVTFDTKLKTQNKTFDYSHSVNISQKLLRSNCYNFTAELDYGNVAGGATPITFTANVTGSWTEEKPTFTVSEKK